MSSIRQVENTMIAYLARHSIEAQPSGLDINHAELFEILSNTVASLLGDADQGPPARYKAGRFPMLNPLALLYRCTTGAKKSKAFQRKVAELSQSLDFLGEDGPAYTDFSLCTGRSIQAYVTAYEKSGNSIFSKLGKQMRKSPVDFFPHEEVLVYLSHPLVRYEAREQFLKGKHLPLLEVDILSQWAKRMGINVAQLGERSPSFASVENGDRNDDGELASLSHAGKLFSRQQWIDAHRALLPYVLNELAKSVTKDSGEIDCEQIWHCLLSLFAVASLHDDVSLLELADTLSMPVANALRDLQCVRHQAVEPETLKTAEHQRFYIEKINHSYIPSSLKVADQLLDAGSSISNSVSESPRVVQSFTSVDDVARISAALSRSSQLLNIGSGALDVKGLLGQAVQAWDEVRQARMDMLSDRQRETVLTSVAIPLPNTEIGTYYNIIPSLENVEGVTCLFATDIAQTAFSHYATTQETTGDLGQISTLLKRVGERTKQVLAHTHAEKTNFIYNMETQDTGVSPASEDTNHWPRVLVTKETAQQYQDATLCSLSDLDIDFITTDALSVANSLRYLNLIVSFGARYTYHRGVELEKVVAAAAEEMQSNTGAGANAFSAIEANMAKLDKCRERYCSWATSNVAEFLEMLVGNIDLIDVELAPLTLKDDMASESNADDIRMVSEAEHHQALQEGNVALEAAKDTLQKERERMDAEASELQNRIEKQNSQLTDMASKLEASEHRKKALNHHLERAERSKLGQGPEIDKSALAAFSEALISYAEAPRPETALAIAERLHADTLIILPSAYESAREATDLNGQNLLRRLLILGTEGHRIINAGKPLYDLKDVLPGDLALNESDTNMNVPKLRQQRVFKEELQDGSVQEWLMECHNWIDFNHRMYFDYDHEREAFVIGYAGRHLSVSSIS